MRGKLLVVFALALVFCMASVSATSRVTDFSITPTNPVPGGTVTLSYDLVSDAPLRTITTDITIPGIVSHQKKDSTNAEEYTFRSTHTIPEDADGTYELLLIIIVPGEAPLIREAQFTVGTPTPEPTQITVAPVEYGVERAQILALGSTDLAVVVDPEVPNVERGEWVYWPMTVINNGDEEMNVLLGVDGVRSWGTYRIDPEPYISLQPGETHQAFMFISIYEDAEPGLRYFMITADHDGVREGREVALAVLKPVDRNPYPGWLFWVIIAVIILAAIIVAIALYRKDREGEDDFVTYY